MDLIYLDYNCFQRGLTILYRQESRWKHWPVRIFLSRQMQEKWNWFDFMHQDETIICPFPERKYAVIGLASLCKVRVSPEAEIYQLGQSFQQSKNLSAKDALHFACAVHIQADFFLTCDDNLRKKAQQLNHQIAIMNPVDYIRQEES